MLVGMNRSELADFLRTRRARVSPIEMGLPGNSRRRVPGLRREEVAQLAGMSVDYYTGWSRGVGRIRRARSSTRWAGR